MNKSHVLAAGIFLLAAAPHGSAHDKIGPVDLSPGPNSKNRQLQVQDFIIGHWTGHHRGYVVFRTQTDAGDVVATELFIEPARKGAWRIRGILRGELSDRFGGKRDSSGKIPVTKTFEAVSVGWGWDISLGRVLLLKDKDDEVVGAV